MENLEEILEQPAIEQETQEELKKENDGGQIASKHGSIGKFNSPESLLEAYNNLQREFTKKCQKLSELEKNVADNEEKETLKNETENSSPAFLGDSWRSKVAEFLGSNAYAKNFSKEISAEILNDPKLQKSENMLEIAWSRVLAKNFKTPEQIANDNSFFENYVLGNEEVKKQVFSSYLSELNEMQTPNLIGASVRGGRSMVVKSSKPTSLKDANEIVLKLFKK